MLTDSGERWLSGSQGRWGCARVWYRGWGYPGGEPDTEEDGETPYTWLKDGVPFAEEGDCSGVWEGDCSGVWEGDCSEVDLEGLELEGEVFFNMGFFFWGVSCVGSVEDSSRGWTGGFNKSLESLLPAMEWVSKVWYRSCTTVALKCKFSDVFPSEMHCTDVEILPSFLNFCPAKLNLAHCRSVMASLRSRTKL